MLLINGPFSAQRVLLALAIVNVNLDKITEETPSSGSESKGQRNMPWAKRREINLFLGLDKMIEKPSLLNKREQLWNSRATY